MKTDQRYLGTQTKARRAAEMHNRYIEEDMLLRITPPSGCIGKCWGLSPSTVFLVAISLTPLELGLFFTY